MDEDALIAKVREARHEISEECGHDIWILYERYQALQRELQDSGRHSILPAPSAPSSTAAGSPTTPD